MGGVFGPNVGDNYGGQINIGRIGGCECGQRFLKKRHRRNGNIHDRGCNLVDGREELST
jgi:hypothetical protein